MESTITFAAFNRMIANWQELDPLRNDECVKAFQIRNIMESEFKAEKDVQEKLNKEQQEIIQNITSDVQKLKKAGAESVKNTKINKLPDGGVNISNIPDDLQEQYSEDGERVQREMDDLMRKEKQIEFDPLTRSDLKEHDMLKGKITRLFKEIIDLSAEKEYDEYEVVENGKQEAEEVADT